jgi:hypothetical protein
VQLPAVYPAHQQLGQLPPAQIAYVQQQSLNYAYAYGSHYHASIQQPQHSYGINNQQHEQQQQLHATSEFSSQRQLTGQEGINRRVRDDVRDDGRAHQEVRPLVRYPRPLEITTLAKEGISATVFCTRMLSQLFRIDELLEHTVYTSLNNSLPKPKLDSLRVEWIRVAVSEHFKGTGKEAELWKKCIAAMNAHIIYLTKKNRKST